MGIKPGELTVTQKRSQLNRYAIALLLEKTEARLPVIPYYDTVPYDLITPSGKRIDVKAGKIFPARGGREAHPVARFSFNRDVWGKPINKKVDLFVCMCLDEKWEPNTIMCIPSKYAPKNSTVVGVPIPLSEARPSNRWKKFVVTMEELKKILK